MSQSQKDGEKVGVGGRERDIGAVLKSAGRNDMHARACH